ncbi:hypothetical protein J4G43_015395 [Bradyrhizobium barranii subsp. barranii]|uniref:Uncharacterized protein n=1 Tax=Bradyrhizobium barranii subsp. barranii TaxID=2823807 RepID=A0A9X9YC15_9BRAD|nr:hypothetical protein J4G43_015395 [Bradyrhizobium barranii subsp. barranii]
MRFGSGFAQGADDIAAGNIALGVSRIVGEGAQGLSLALGGVASARAFGVRGTYQPPPVQPVASPPAATPASPVSASAPTPPAPASAPVPPEPVSAPAPAAPASAPATLAPSSAPAVHGNSLDSTRLHHVYEIHDTATPGIPHKTGVSGQPLQKSGLSPRAAKQVNALNKANPVPSGQPPRFSQRVIGQGLPNRRAAFAFEQYGVNVQTNTLGKPGVGNSLPKPNQMYGPGAR